MLWKMLSKTSASIPFYEITSEGEAHRDEMKENCESYENYVKAGWLTPIDEYPFEFYWTPDPAI